MNITREEGLAAIKAWWESAQQGYAYRDDDVALIAGRITVTAGQVEAVFAEEAPSTDMHALRAELLNMSIEANDSMQAELQAMTAQSAQWQQSCDSAYTQRNTLAVAFATLALQLGWRAGWGRDNDNDEGKSWNEAWRTAVYIDLPNGKQLSWHMNPDVESWAKQMLPAYTGDWDGTFIGRDAPEWLSLLPGFDEAIIGRTDAAIAAISAKTENSTFESWMNGWSPRFKKASWECVLARAAWEAATRAAKASSVLLDAPIEIEQAPDKATAVANPTEASQRSPTLLDVFDNLRQKAKRLDKLRELCGFIADGSATEIAIAHDDATPSWRIYVGDPSRDSRRYDGASFEEVIDKAVAVELIEDN